MWQIMMGWVSEADFYVKIRIVILVIVFAVKPFLSFPQGVMMGILTAAGSLARSLGPLFVSNLYYNTGPLITFAAVDGIVMLSIVILLVFAHRLVPYRYEL